MTQRVALLMVVNLCGAFAQDDFVPPQDAPGISALFESAEVAITMYDAQELGLEAPPSQTLRDFVRLAPKSIEFDPSHNCYRAKLFDSKEAKGEFCVMHEDFDWLAKAVSTSYVSEWYKTALNARKGQGTKEELETLIGRTQGTASEDKVGALTTGLFYKFSEMNLEWMEAWGGRTFGPDMHQAFQAYDKVEKSKVQHVLSSPEEIPSGAHVNESYFAWTDLRNVHDSQFTSSTIVYLWDQDLSPSRIGTEAVAELSNNPSDNLTFSIFPTKADHFIIRTNGENNAIAEMLTSKSPAKLLEAATNTGADVYWTRPGSQALEQITPRKDN